MAMTLLPGEADLLAAVVDNLPDDNVKLVYADWLEDHGDQRAAFVRAYVAAAKAMKVEDFPAPKRLAEEWLELIGYRLNERLATAHASKLRKKLLPLARPALRMKPTGKGSRGLSVGASKLGGVPDLPPGFAWPLGRDCRATYNQDTAGVEELAGFVAQVNFAEIADTQASRTLGLPPEGVLSFFSYTDADWPDVVGAMAVFFPDAAKLVSTKPPKGQPEGNGTIHQQRLLFEETLDVPTCSSGGPWAKVVELAPEGTYEALMEPLWLRNLRNMFGYARSTTASDPTPSKASRHLIVLENGCGCTLHIQIPAKALAARDFGKITLNYVDFD